LGIYLKEYKSTHKRDTCTPMFISALFTIARQWNQPKCSTTNKQIKEIWYMHTTEYYSVIRKIEIMPFAGTVEHHTE
jgi:hypothetical protein